MLILTIIIIVIVVFAAMPPSMQGAAVLSGIIGGTWGWLVCTFGQESIWGDPIIVMMVFMAIIGSCIAGIRGASA